MSANRPLPNEAPIASVAPPAPAPAPDASTSSAPPPSTRRRQDGSRAAEGAVTEREKRLLFTLLCILFVGLTLFHGRRVA